jgi:hypothetical protein
MFRPHREERARDISAFTRVFAALCVPPFEGLTLRRRSAGEFACGSSSRRQPISGLPEIGTSSAQVGYSRLAIAAAVPRPMLRDASQRKRCDAPQHEAD